MPPPNDDDGSAGSHDVKANNFVQRNLSLSMQYNLRSTFCTISSAYPTPESVAEAVSLAKRAGMTGDGTIIGVGSAAAIDLAKATSTNLGSSLLVLSPYSLGGLWAASSPQHLVLDTKEECIVSKKTTVKDTVITLDEQRLLGDLPLYREFQPSARDAYCSGSLAMSHFAAGSLAVLLSQLNSGVDDRYHSELISLSSELAMVLRLASKLRQNGDDEMREKCTAAAMSCLLETIPRLHQVLGDVSTETSGPQTLANSLLPAHFPQCHYVSFLGCTLNGVCVDLSGSQQDLVQSVASAILDTGVNSSPKDVLSLPAWSEQMTRDCGIPSLSSYAYGTPDLKTLFGSLGSYETLLDQIFSHTYRERIEQVLRRSL